METQAETGDHRAEYETLAARLDDERSQPPSKDKPKKKGKEPSKEEVRAAVAGVVLAEMKFWSEPIVSLIGEQHPNKESFLKGVAYVIGGYMHFARRGLEAWVERRKKEAESKTCSLLAPVSRELKEYRAAWENARTQTIVDLEKNRKEEIKRAKREINQRYEKLISEVRRQELPEDARGLMEREATIKSAFDGACSTIDAEAGEIRKQIEEIEGGAEDWNSEKRKERRRSLELVIKPGEAVE